MGEGKKNELEEEVVWERGVRERLENKEGEGERKGKKGWRERGGEGKAEREGVFMDALQTQDHAARVGEVRTFRPTFPSLQWSPRPAVQFSELCVSCRPRAPPFGVCPSTFINLWFSSVLCAGQGCLGCLTGRNGDHQCHTAYK